MKIAVLIPTIKPGGAEKQAVLLATLLASYHEIHFIIVYDCRNESAALKKMLVDGNVNVHYLDRGYVNKWFSLITLLKSIRCDYAFNYLTICNVLGGCIERYSGVKTIYNGIRNSRLAPIKMMMERLVHNQIADFTVFNCFSGADYFKMHGFCEEKIIIIPNCFPQINNPYKHDDSQKKTIVTVGRFESQKDYKTAIQAISLLRKSTQDFVYIIIGHGHLESDIRRWIKSYGIESYSKVYISPDNVQDLIKSSDIYLSSSIFEGTSNSIMEAMNWCLPVVATDVGDNSKLIDHGRSGYLCQIRNCEEIASRLYELLNDADKRILFGLEGNSILRNKYSTESFVKSYLSLMNEN